MGFHPVGHGIVNLVYAHLSDQSKKEKLGACNDGGGTFCPTIVWFLNRDTSHGFVSQALYRFVSTIIFGIDLRHGIAHGIKRTLFLEVVVGWNIELPNHCEPHSFRK